MTVIFDTTFKYAPKGLHKRHNTTTTEDKGRKDKKRQKNKKELYGNQAKDYKRHGSFLVFRTQERLEKTRQI